MESRSTRMERFRQAIHISKELVPLKLVYFIMYAGVAILLPFVPLYQKQLGMTTVESGIINGLMPFIGFLARPLFGMIADRLKRHKMVFMMCCMSTGLLHMLLIFVPNVPKPPPPPLNFTLTCNQQTSLCQDNITNVFSHCDNNSTNSNQILNTDCRIICRRPENLTRVCLQDEHNGQICLKTSQFEFYNILSNYDLETLIPYHAGPGTIIDISQKTVYNSTYDKSQQDCVVYKLGPVTYKGLKYNDLRCENDSELECQFFCDQLNCLVHADPSEYAFKTVFWSFLVINLFAAIMYSPLTNLMDAMSYQMIGEKRHRWGQQRVWGTLGFVTLALCSTPILRLVVLDDGKSNYSVCFYIFSGFMGLAAILSYLMKVPEDFRCLNLLKNTCKLLREFPVIVFLMAMFLLGAFFGIVNSFLFWYLMELQKETNPDSDDTLVCSLALFCAAGMELPTIFFSGKLIKKFGEVACISSAFVGYTIRFMAYYFVQNAWHVLPFELLHGITFGVMFPAATMYANKISPPGMSATLQGLLSGTHFGFGWGTGALVAGVLYNDFGARTMFLSCSVTSLVALIVFVTVNVFFIKEKKADEIFTVGMNGGNASINDTAARHPVTSQNDDDQPLSGHKPRSGDEDDNEVSTPTDPLMEEVLSTTTEA